MRNQQPVIIKRGRRRGEEASAGGAWKVAFADFTMAMMALFLILWISSSASQQEKEEVAESLRGYSVFSGTRNPFELGGKSPKPFEAEGYSSLIKGVAEEILAEPLEGAGDGTTQNSIFETPFNSLDSMSVLADLIREMGKQLEAFDNLAVDVVPQGLRIRLQDSDDRQMFARGGATMHPFFEDMLLAIAPVFARIDNKLAISGHTDAVPFNGDNYTNWELSGARAMEARKLLEVGGTPADRILQMAAMSDRVPAKADDPTSSSNRRIEILVLTDKAKAELLGLFDYQQPDNAVDRAKESARKNQPVTR